MKTFRITLLLLILVFHFSCTNENEPQEQDTINNINLSNLSMDIDFTSEYDLSKVSLDQLISATVKELYEIELNSTQNQHRRSGDPVQDTNYSFVGVDIHIDGNTATFIPIDGSGNTQASSDNEKCGGQAGDGWKSYGTCMSESCVEGKVQEASAELSENLTSGKCLDIRIKRNTLNARVCGRLIDC